MSLLRRLFVAVVVAWGGLAHADVRLALMGPPGADLGGLVPLAEVALGTLDGVTLVDREAIESVLKEQQLQAAFGAGSAGDRVELGRILKADILVLLRDRAEPKPHVEVVISETKQGIRLLAAPLPAELDAKQKAARVRELAEQAFAKREFSDLVAVPPLVNNSLVRDLDHFQGAYAKLIEESIARRDGLAVIELAEAKAIAGELTLAGGEKVARKLPYYLEGEFRGEGHAEKCRVAFTLRLMRGSEQLGERSGSDLEPQNVGSSLCSAAGAMLDEAVGGAAKAFDIKAETTRLEQRVEAHLAIGNWDEAIALAEASLLIDPEQPKIHGHALAVLAHEIEERKSKMRSSREPRQIRSLFPLMAAALPHIEGYFKGEVNADRKTWGKETFNFNEGRIADAKRGLHPEDFQQWWSFQEYMRDFTARTLDRKAAQKVDDHSIFLLLPWAFSSSFADNYDDYLMKNFQQHLDERYAMARKLRYLTDKKFPFADFVSMRLLNDRRSAAQRTAMHEAYVKFLDDLDALDWTLIDDRVKNTKKHALAQYARLSGGPDPALATSWKPPPKPTWDQEDAKLHPIRILTVNSEGRSTNVPARSLEILTWMPIQDGIELVITRTQVFLMRKKGQLDLLPLTFESLFQNEYDNWRPTNANFCWDGRYLWGVSPAKEGQFLVAIDPKSEQIWKIDASAGLPPMDKVRGAAITAVAPGKAFVAGNFGRMWIATADLDPERGITFKVFHEARKVDVPSQGTVNPLEDTQGIDVEIARPCKAFCTIKDFEAPNGAVRPLVILDHEYPWLVIDPDTKAMRVIHAHKGHDLIRSDDLRNKIVRHHNGQSGGFHTDLLSPQIDSIDRSERVWQLQDPVKGPTPFRAAGVEIGGRYYRIASPPLRAEPMLFVGAGDDTKGKPMKFVFPLMVGNKSRLFRSHHYGLVLAVQGDGWEHANLFTVELKGEYAKPLMAEKH